MAQAQRQSNLFAAEDFRTIYRTLSEINFTAYDFDTIKDAMIEYLQRNFPEDFNDFIESSEFIAIIELLAYMGQTIAFRQDLNVRENFMDTAERKESVLRLANMLNYSPKRNIPGTGVIKFYSIRTTEDVLDSNGSDLANTTIKWNDANNVDFLEHFILVLNRALITQNPFGSPVKSGTLNTIPIELYSIDVLKNTNVVYALSSTINGESFTYEIVNSTFTDGQFITEVEPDPQNSLGMFYLNDGQGNSSDNTGFFAYLKQGILSYEDFSLEVPLPNREININVTDVNEFDVWVQTINSAGIVLDKWVKVPSIAGSNVIYNSVIKNTRKIFKVVSEANDTITIQFADGNFGDIPYGILRVWYRKSANKQLIAKSEHFGLQTVQFPYVDKNGNSQNLNVTFQLTASIGNSLGTETTEQIKTNASQVFYTQDRMVSGEDYNIYPFFKNADILKMKAINRTHAGHSRYIDINDPTGTVQNLNVFAEDGIIYKDIQNTQVSFLLTSSLTSNTIIQKYIQPTLSADELTNFYYDTYRKAVYDVDGNAAWKFNSSEQLQWVPLPTAKESNKGYFVLNDTTFNFTNAISIGSIATGKTSYLTEKCLLEFTDSTGKIIKYATIENVINNGDPKTLTIGPVELNKDILQGYIVTRIYPTFRRLFNTSEKLAIHTQLNLKNTFGIGYDYKTTSFYVIAPNNLNTTAIDFSLINAKDNTSDNLDESWFIKLEYQAATSATSASYLITIRGLRYVFESEEDVRFYFNNAFKTIDIESGKAKKDLISLLKVNVDKRAQIDSVSLSNPGSGYTVAPVVSFQQAGEIETAEATTYLSWNTVSGGTGGTGYVPIDNSLSYLDSATVDSDGVANEIYINNAGVLATDGRTVRIKATLSENAAGTLLVDADAIGKITVGGGGTGYSSAPVVTILPPSSGTTATAIAVISQTMTGVTFSNPGYQGSGYHNVPSIIVDPPGFTGTTWTVVHGLGQKYVNFELIDATHNVINTIYNPPIVTYVDSNTLTVDWNGVSTDGFINIIKSRIGHNAVSDLQAAENIWTIVHNLISSEGIVNLDVILQSSVSHYGKEGYPLIEYTSDTQSRVIFPTGVETAGYAVIHNSYLNAGATGNGYLYTQSSSALVWTVTHNLGRRHLNVDVAVLGSEIDASDFSIIPDSTKYYNIRGLYDYPTINFVDENSLTITFLTVTAGKAIITGDDMTEMTTHIQAVGVAHMELGDTSPSTCLPVIINAAGSGYVATEVMQIYGGTLATSNPVVATITIDTVDGSGGVTGVSVTEPGEYEALPDIVNIPLVGSASGVGLKLDLNFRVKNVTLTTAGDGYQTTPVVIIGAPTGTCVGRTQATGVATTNGSVTSVNVTNAGTGYTSTDISNTSLIDIAIGSGVKATASGTLTSSVTGITMTNAGTGYISGTPPVVTLPGPATVDPFNYNSTATGIAIVNSAGNVTGITVTDPGSGYLSADGGSAVTISPSGVVDSVEVIDTGYGYTAQPIIVYASTAGGTGASTISVQGFVSRLSVTDPGRSYTEETTVTFSSPTAYGAMTATGTVNIRADKSFTNDIKFNLSSLLTYEDGYQDPKKALITFHDDDNDQIPDDPLSFDKFVNTTRYIFQETYTEFDGYVYYKLSRNVLQADNQTEENLIITNGVDWAGKYIYRSDLSVFKKIDAVSPYATTILDNDADSTLKFKAYIGRSKYITPVIDTVENIITKQDEEDVFFQWKHYAPVDQRVDPSVTNLVDIFILSQLYYTEVVAWKANNKSIDLFPEAPTSTDLAISMDNLNDYKSISDEIVYKPVTFKLLFGATAASELQATFKIIKIAGSVLSDNELRSRVVATTNEFFEIANWDLGESFYYTELAAYIHQSMPAQLSSIVIVPVQSESNFGNLFQVKAELDELFLSTLTVNNVEIVKGYTEQNLKIR